MEMKEPFDIEIEDVVYSVFPEEEDTYVIFKEGVEYVQIIKDTEYVDEKQIIEQMKVPPD